MTISAKMICDSISQQNIRLPTLQCRYPKFIHGEAKTHRKMRIADKVYELLEEVGFMDFPEFSRNASSSRAIPVTRLIQDVLDDPVIPIEFGRNRPGMQAIELLHGEDLLAAKRTWLLARDRAVDSARDLLEQGVHKQIVNRIIEPWCHINVVVTATEWANFFALRRHKDAQPEMKALADSMWEAQQTSTPKLLLLNEWHLPYITDEQNTYTLEEKIRVSVARCARVSYLTQEGKVPSLDEDLALYDRLFKYVPLHASPAEHQAKPDEMVIKDLRYAYANMDPTGKVSMAGTGKPTGAVPNQHGNFVGWCQYRKMLPDEYIADR